jgi:hypothetical protein
MSGDRGGGTPDSLSAQFCKPRRLSSFFGKAAITCHDCSMCQAHRKPVSAAKGQVLAFDFAQSQALAGKADGIVPLSCGAAIRFPPRAIVSLHTGENDLCCAGNKISSQHQRLFSVSPWVVFTSRFFQKARERRFA